MQLFAPGTRAATGAVILAAGLLALSFAALTRSGGRASAGPPILGQVPSFGFTDDQGLPYRLAQLRGRVWVGSLFTTRTTGDCPLVTNLLARLELEARGSALGDELALVAIRAEPGFDPPRVLAEYARHFRADGANWIFVAPPESGLASFRRTAPETCRQAIVVDRAGFVRGRFDVLTPEGRIGLASTLLRVFETGSPSRPAPTCDEGCLDRWASGDRPVPTDS